MYQDQRVLVPGSESPCTRIRESLYQDQRVLVPVCDFVYCLYQTARLSGRRDHAETPGDDSIFCYLKGVYCLYQTARMSGRHDHAETPGDDSIFCYLKDVYCLYQTARFSGRHDHAETPGDDSIFCYLKDVYCLYQTARFSGRHDHAETPGDDSIFCYLKGVYCLYQTARLSGRRDHAETPGDDSHLCYLKGAVLTFCEQSDVSAANCFQHACLRVMCKACATHWVLMMRSMSCATQCEGTGQGPHALLVFLEGGMSATSFLHSSFLQVINAVMVWPVHVHMFSASSLRSLPKAALETVQMLNWLSSDCS